MPQLQEQQQQEPDSLETLHDVGVHQPSLTMEELPKRGRGRPKKILSHEENPDSRSPVQDQTPDSKMDHEASPGTHQMQQRRSQQERCQ